MDTIGITPAADSGLLSPAWADTGVDELVGDRAWLGAMLSVEAALARAQARCGLIPARSAQVITAAADADAHRLNLAGLVAGVRATANPVVVLVTQFTALVAERDPAAAEHVHQGGTSQDVLDSAMMVLCARTLHRIHADLAPTAAALAELARRHRDTPAVARTLTQHAVPTTFGLRAAGWLQLVLDADERISRVLDGGLPASLGGAAGTLAAYQEYARLASAPIGSAVDLIAPFAEELGLAEPTGAPWHAIRTPLADVASALAVLVGALGKVAADVQVLTRTEIGEVAEATAAGRGASSAMPQKHNPVLATMITTAARLLPAQVGVLYQSMVAEDERSAGAWHAEWQALRESLRLGAGAARNAVALTEGLTVCPDRMLANLALTDGAVVSERVTAVLAPLIGRKPAKSLLTRASVAASASGASLADVLVEVAADEGHHIDRALVADLMRPQEYLGAAGDLVDRVLGRYHVRAGH